jgi:hypothetical protein
MNATREVLSGVGHDNEKPPICGRFCFRKEPSDGLEPSTPSLPSRRRDLRWVARGVRPLCSTNAPHWPPESRGVEAPSFPGCAIALLGRRVAAV